MEQIVSMSNDDKNGHIFNRFYDTIGLNDDIDRNQLTKQLFDEMLNKRQWSLIPGVDRLIQHLYRHNIPMAIATNSPQSVIKILSKKFENFFDKYFTHYVCASDDPEVKAIKPDPQVYSVCMNRFVNRPESEANVLIIEDSLQGIRGAVETGMKTLLVNDRKYSNFDSIADRITVIVNCFDNFDPQSLGLPAY
ncbi:pseudouridine-5'-phosphatase-like [Oppia nitens]|uniref:pseudouridine-5'-phosphatase-like n=1 Tax=Oppia nitens TaxID=1686743 RepID=UPI0023D99D03|nr:pseudouridine-5'-phosphatase-like [Oppia nitens]